MHHPSSRCSSYSRSWARGGGRHEADQRENSFKVDLGFIKRTCALAGGCRSLINLTFFFVYLDGTEEAPIGIFGAICSCSCRL